MMDYHTHFMILMEIQFIHLVWHMKSLQWFIQTQKKLLSIRLLSSSTFLDNFQAQYELGEGLIVRNIGHHQFTGDAFGNIILPDGSNHAALRVKIFQQTAAIQCLLWEFHYQQQKLKQQLINGIQMKVNILCLEFHMLN